MNEFQKEVLLVMFAAIVSAGVSSFATVTSLDTKMLTIEKSITKVDARLDKFDERIRQTEINQAAQRYLAAN